MKTVRMHTGQVVPEPALKAIMINLRDLGSRGQAVALFEATEMAADPHHKPFGQAKRILVKAGILDGDGKMSNVVREVIRATMRTDAKGGYYFISPVTGKKI